MDRVSLNNMSDSEKSQNKQDESGEEWRRTQIVKRPKFRPRSNEEKEDDALSDAKPTAKLSDDNPLLRRAISQNAHADHDHGTKTLGNTREVILLIRGMVERIVMQKDKPYTLGRFDMGIQGDDEIDLTPYGAMDRGVSRHHAVLHLEDEHVYLTDLESTNGTYVGGERLEPDTPTILHKGDEVLLGRLAIQVMFR